MFPINYILIHGAFFVFKLRFVVHGLETGEQYVFRVKAVNAVGFSENSQESEAITVQAALSKYDFVQLSALFLERVTYFQHSISLVLFAITVHFTAIEYTPLVMFILWNVAVLEKRHCLGKKTKPIQNAC